jgi:NAD(P)-dependent dehydrogenase (short-subunit alcohol dehydrogenase family)
MTSHQWALEGKTALVTGGAKRIGRACALALADAGANVVIHYNTSQHEAEAVAIGVRHRGAKVWTVQADLSDPDDADELLPRAMEAAGPVDVLLNNAATFPASTLYNFTLADVTASVQMNAMAPVQLARAFVAQGREGAIINFLDTRIADYDTEHVAYHLSKRMLFSLTRMMAIDYAPAVRVNAVAPGIVLPPVNNPQTDMEAMADTNPLQSVGSPEGVADAAMFLLRSRFVTGQVIYVDGGRHLRGKVYG